MTLAIRDEQPISDQAEVTQLGAGRSGQVFLIKRPDGPVARKVFFSSGLAKVVHYLTSGAGNPYAWNEDALWAAYYRRRVMAALVRFWFGDKLVVSDALDTGWDEDSRAGYLDIEFMEGRPVALHQPCSRQRDDELEIQVKQIMEPLQTHLVQCGADGLAWQAGKGNPVALDNFMLIARDGTQHRFGWIDLESGVPALFPLNPIALFGYYLPASFKYRRPLFDDVDIEKMRDYVRQRSDAIEAAIGEDPMRAFHEYLEKLAQHQEKWKGMRRVDRSITEQLKKGRLTAAEAAHYRHSPFVWRALEGRRLTGRVAVALLIKLPMKIFGSLQRLDFRWFFHHVWSLAWSQQYRIDTARQYVARFIIYDTFSRIGSRIPIWGGKDTRTEHFFNRLARRIVRLE